MKSEKRTQKRDAGNGQLFVIPLVMEDLDIQTLAEHTLLLFYYTKVQLKDCL